MTEGNHLHIKDLCDQVKVIEENDYHGKENFIIENIENCTIIVPFLIKCMYVKNMKNCNLQIAGVRAASFIHNSVGTSDRPNVIYLASHQIRIHHSCHTRFLLVARSNPIIEHCTDLAFGDLEKTEFGLEEKH